LKWPEPIIDQSLREILWEPAPGILSRSKVGATRALLYVRRNATRAKHLDLSRIDDFSNLLFSVLSDIDRGELPSYTLSPKQYDYLEQPVTIKGARTRVTGLLHHLVVERGIVKERDLARPDVAETVSQQTPGLLARLRLPARLREAHGARVASITPVTSAPTALLDRLMVTVVGPLSHGSGLGAAARACVEAFKAARIPVEVLNLRAGWGRDDESAGSGITARVRGDINVIHFNPDVLIENLSRFGIEQFEGRYNIGYFVWETSQASLAHRLGVDLVDEVWVPTEYCREIFEKITDKPVFVVRTPVPKIDGVGWASRRYFGIPDGTFTFVFAFDGASRFTRKNPIAVVEAFRRAFPSEDGVALVLKTQNTSRLHPIDERMYADIRRTAREDPRITVIDESFSSNEVHGLIAVCDCYVSLHRSEGFGYGMAEAMKLKIPVIATEYSGNADFTIEETSYPVRSLPVPVPAGEFVYEEQGQAWAEPDLEHAAERMREVMNDPHRQEKVDRAHALVSRRYEVNAVGDTYRKRIEAIRAGATAATGAAIMGAG
jgi:glycosyltransferase involved in cell wall biosynthesis